LSRGTRHTRSHVVHTGDTHGLCYANPEPMNAGQALRMARFLGIPSTSIPSGLHFCAITYSRLAVQQGTFRFGGHPALDLCILTSLLFFRLGCLPRTLPQAWWPSITISRRFPCPLDSSLGGRRASRWNLPQGRSEFTRDAVPLASGLLAGSFFWLNALFLLAKRSEALGHLAPCRTNASPSGRPIGFFQSLAGISSGRRKNLPSPRYSVGRKPKTCVGRPPSRAGGQRKVKSPSGVFFSARWWPLPPRSYVHGLWTPASSSWFIF